MHISAEGKIGILLALIGLAGAGAMMVAPEHTEIGWLLIAVALTGGAFLAGHHFADLKKWRRKMVALIGMAVCVLGLFGFTTMYFFSRPTPKSPTLATSVHSNDSQKSASPRISIGCYQEVPPKTLQADEEIQVLWLFPTPIENGGGGLATQFNRSGQSWKWPVAGPLDAIFISVYRCEVTNYGVDPVIDLQMALDLTFYEAVPVPGQSENARGHGNVKLHRPWLISIQKIDAGRENAFKFYLVNNQDNLFVHVLMPRVATLRLLDEQQRMQVNLTVTEMGGEYPLLFGPHFIPAAPSNEQK
jgi:hypothetical protein